MSNKNLIQKFNSSGEFAIQYLTISEFFKKDIIKRVPPYQRPYSWEKQHVKRLIEDINKSSVNNKEWFIGPVFTAYKDDDKIRELLDGQQRMTTIALILRCLYFADYLVTEDQWKNPIFKIDVEAEDEETEQKKIREEYLKKFKTVKEQIKKLLLIEEEQGIGVPSLYKSKFHTAESTKNSLNKFFEQIDTIKTRDGFNQTSRGIEAEHGSDFAPTKISINQNIKEIEEVIKGFLVKRNKVVKNGLKNLIDFITALTKLSFIEIPLNKDEDVLDIFESINNRGKKLSLSDIIRFRTIKEYADNPTMQEKVAKDWNQIFLYSGKLSSNQDGAIRYFSSLDVFFERYINAIAHKDSGYTENSERIDRFTEYFKSNGRSLSEGVKDVLQTLQKWHFIVSGELANKGIFRGCKGNVLSFLYLLKASLTYSQNSQIAFISLLRMNIPYPFSDGESLSGTPHMLLQHFKSTFCISVFHRIKSNEARNLFIRIAASYDENLMALRAKDDNAKVDANEKTYPSGPYNYENFKLEYEAENGEKKKVIDVPPLKLSNSNLHNILWVKGSDKATAELILGLYQIICGETIPAYSEYDWNHLDHVMPEKWFKNQGWNTINSEELLQESIMEIENEDVRETFDKLQKQEDFYSETKWAPTFIQLIGNKVHLTASANREKSNSFWHEHPDNDSKSPRGAKIHLEEYFKNQPNNAFIVPYGPEKIYEMEDFTIKSIIERTVEISTKIVSDYSNFKVQCN